MQAICDYVHGHLTFSYGSSSPQSTAADVHASGYGVCRDFTHLAVSLCRALNIPARYVFGYLPEIEVPKRDEPMDFAAWMEVYLGDRWWTFDPRNNERRKGRVLIGRGRDAGDVAMATTFGAPFLESMTVIAEEVVRAALPRLASQHLQVACRPATVRSRTWLSPTSPIGDGAEEEAPVVAVGHDDDDDPVAREAAARASATVTSDSISQPSLPLTVVDLAAPVRPGRLVRVVHRAGHQALHHALGGVLRVVHEAALRPQLADRQLRDPRRGRR